MFSALELAIASGMEFCAEDFKAIYGEFRGGYWMGSEDEWVYAVAIVNYNNSCVKAWEEFKGRKPFLANDIEGSPYGVRTFRHSSQFRAQRDRLAAGFSVRVEKVRCYITGFDDKNGVVRAASYKDNRREGKPTKLYKWTHEQVLAMFPAPKKIKAKAA
jgi:hypothetical protein